MKLPKLKNPFRKKEEKRQGQTLEELLEDYKNISLAGINVNEKKAMQFIAFFSCIRVISESIAVLPLKTYKDSENKEIAKDHPVYKLLKKKPNSKMTIYTLKQITGYHLTTWGNAYWYIEFDERLRLKEIIPLLPDRTNPILTPSGDIIYSTTVDNQQMNLRSDQVCHFKGPSMDGIVGLSLLSLLKETIGLGLAANEYGARFFGQGTHIGGVLESPNKLSDIAYERLKKDMETNGGITNSHKLKILEEGLTFKRLGLPPGDSQFLETRKFQTEELARFFRVPPHKIGDLSKTSYNSIEQQDIEFFKDTLTPYLTMMEQEINSKIFIYKDEDLYFVEHDINAILRGDVKTRYEAYAIARQWGWLSANDIRKKENEPPIEGGNVYLSPMNMTPSTELGKPSPDPLESKRHLLHFETMNVANVDEKRHSKVEVRNANKRFLLSSSYKQKFSTVIEEFTRTEIQEFKRQVKKHSDSRSGIEDLFKEIKDFYNQHRSEIETKYSQKMNEYLSELRHILEEELGQKINFKEFNEDIEKYLNSYVNRHITSNMDGLNEIIKAQTELNNKDIENSLDELGQRSVSSEAMEESNRLGNYFAVVSYKFFQRKAKWVTTGSSSCPICRKMDGKIVSAGKPFIRKNDEIKLGDSVFSSGYDRKHAPLHNGCDCIVIAN